ncbi:NADPH-dependent FMN reductase [Paenibacillus sp. MSJ-34]|uniref:NADPH-dependent FMN reductase n=1 Tax=Paenibacillus sp. MSJ-34 TaxID=2841529 RepID=UPI001C0FC67D|nr:NADPH-dependent FMN reductase [Paenibacillus sp. MSJ-34]MBU5445524.1 NAD(P)H-dependent oxidoreductase [Paenibacillus sp. MSJ-34]
MRLLGISGTLAGSKTLIAVEKVLDAVKRHDPDVEIQLLDLKKYNIQFCDGRRPDDYTGDTKEVIDLVSSADFYIIGTPIYQASMTGALKNIFDLVPVSALQNKVIGFVATGGTYQHYLVIENQLKPIAGFFRAFVAPSYVYLHNDHFGENNEIQDPDVLERIERLAKETVFMQKRLKM